MTRVDELDLVEIDGVTCCHGHVLPFGASLLSNGGINFSINSADAEGCELQLYHRGAENCFANIRLPDNYRIGNNYSIIVFGQDVEDLEYTYHFSGKMDPSAGFRFDASVPLLDPYAKLLSGREIWGENSMKPLRCKLLQEDYPWEGDRPLEIPFEDMVIYEMHVRGFTKDPSSPAKYRGTYAGVVEMIPHLKALGINCVELLPIFEFDELQYDWIVDGRRVYNYWGYSTVGFFAPKSGYASSGPHGLAADELKNMVRQLHRNGIAVILDVVFNHTAEEGSEGPTLSYRGIDNRTYYMLDENGEYLDFTGCRNTVNCNNVVVRQHIIDCLRYWVSEYHMDGFRFDEAPILSRGTNGTPLQNPPLLEALAHDPILAKSTLIAECWDAAGLYQQGSFPAPAKWAEWNGQYRDCIRRFIKGDAGMGPELLLRIQGSPDLYKDKGIQATLNFVTCHDGFTLNDLVSYNEKHNLNNGEDNRDGAGDNASWNCGEEGHTDNPEIEALRNRQIKNAFALLMLSRGTPMMLSGDEFRNSQNGNNNAYCQDNPISWLNWDNLDSHADVFNFFRKLIHLRREHPVLRRREYFTEWNASGYPELSFHGEQAWNLNMWAPFLTFGFMYAEPSKDFGTESDCFIYCGVNAHWESHRLELPILPEGMQWQIYVDSANADTEKQFVPDRQITLTPRSLMVLTAR